MLVYLFAMNVSTSDAGAQRFSNAIAQRSTHSIKFTTRKAKAGKSVPRLDVQASRRMYVQHVASILNSRLPTFFLTSG